MRVFLCRLSHESNGFAPGFTILQDFTYRRGEDMLASAGSGSLVHAIRDRAEALGVELLPSFDLGASPGPMVSDAVVDVVLQHIDTDLPMALEAGIDGIFVILHGAMVSESHDDVEGMLLERIAHHLAGRAIPVAAILDLHANVSCEMTDNANVMLAFRCNPHTDAVESGLRTFDLLLDVIQSGKLCRTHLVQLPILLPPVGTATASQPMSGLLEIARKHESDEILAISVCVGFSHADTSNTGLSFQLVAWDVCDAAVARAIQDLTHSAVKHAKDGLSEEWEIEAAITDALDHAEYPTVLVEPADNIGGGAPGDGTWLLQAMLDRGLDRCGVILADADAVTALQNVAVGQTVEITLGGKRPSISGPAVTVSATVLKHTDGEFEVEDRHSHFVSARGTRIKMGKSVLLKTGGVCILLNTLATAPNDLGQWRCMGIDPESLHFIGVKAAVAHRQAYDRISRRSYTVSTPGPCTSDLLSLPYKKLRRPIFPFDNLSGIPIPTLL